METIITYEGFLEEIMASVKSALGQEYNICIQEVLKNNDHLRKTMVIRREGAQISPSIHLDEFYREYTKGKSDISEICDTIVRIYNSHCNRTSEDAVQVYNYNFIKDKIAFKLINAEKNKSLLQDVPWVPYLDLAIVFYIVVSIENDSVDGTILIKNNFLKVWGISKETLIEVAKLNTPKLQQSEIRTMESVICSALEKQGVDTQEFMDLYGFYFNPQMLVLSDSKMIYGAATILYEGLLKKISDDIGKDLCILPSSVHEVIVLPFDEGVDTEQLNDMVRSINFHDVDACSVLSDHIYIFRRNDNALHIA